MALKVLDLATIVVGVSTVYIHAGIVRAHLHRYNVRLRKTKQNFQKFLLTNLDIILEVGCFRMFAGFMV